MKHKTLLAVVEKLEALAAKLPGPLQRPILEELTPVKELFLLARPPALLLLGCAEADETAIVNGLFNSHVAQFSEGAGVWRDYVRATGGGRMQFFDGRAPVTPEAVLEAVLEGPGNGIDALVFCAVANVDPDRLSAAVERTVALVNELESRGKAVPPIVAVQMVPEGMDRVAARQSLHARLVAIRDLGRHVAGTVDLPSAFRFRSDGSADLTFDDRVRFELAAELLARELPLVSRLEMARLSGVRKVQSEIAGTLIKSMSAICGAIGAQPIPLADFPVLTALQGAMVAGVLHISGREWSLTMASKFLGALGANIGFGLVFRETARAAVKVLPGWGNAISGGIAGVGTYAVGKAAVSYFIEGASMEEAKKLWNKVRKKPKELPS